MRRHRLQQNGIDEDVNGLGRVNGHRTSEMTLCSSLKLLTESHTARDWDEPSFIAETSFVKAPLNSRVSMGPVTPNNKGKAKQESLDHIPVDVQEAIILEDLLYVLMVCAVLSFLAFW